VSELIGKRIPVLDDGFVQLVDVMGGDSSIVQAARVSYGAGTKTVRKDRGLIRYLMRHRHTTPFEMAEMKFLVRVPMDCWRQWIRHRTANVNEYSTRYSEAIDSAQTTPPDGWRSQAKKNKQGSGEAIPLRVGAELTEREELFHQAARSLYKHRLDQNVAREQARKDLPLSTYTEAFWKMDLHNLFHFLSLRMDAHAQWEIRQYATVIGESFVAPLFPLAWEAFVDYRLEAITFSGPESRILREILGSSPLADLTVVLREEAGLSGREVEEFLQKIGRDGSPEEEEAAT